MRCGVRCTCVSGPGGVGKRTRLPARVHGVARRDDRRESSGQSRSSATRSSVSMGSVSHLNRAGHRRSHTPGAGHAAVRRGIPTTPSRSDVRGRTRRSPTPPLPRFTAQPRPKTLQGCHSIPLRAIEQRLAPRRLCGLGGFFGLRPAVARAIGGGGLPGFVARFRFAGTPQIDDITHTPIMPRGLPPVDGVSSRAKLL